MAETNKPYRLNDKEVEELRKYDMAGSRRAKELLAIHDKQNQAVKPQATR